MRSSPLAGHSGTPWTSRDSTSWFGCADRGTSEGASCSRSGGHSQRWIASKKPMPALALILHLANYSIGPVTRAAIGKAVFEPHAQHIHPAALRPETAAASELAKHPQRRNTAVGEYRRTVSMTTAAASRRQSCRGNWPRLPARATATKGRFRFCRGRIKQWIG
jgi:hypothetical protein